MKEVKKTDMALKFDISDTNSEMIIKLENIIKKEINKEYNRDKTTQKLPTENGNPRKI